MPRRVPVAIRNKVQAALDDLVTKEVIAEVKQLLRDRFMNLYLYKLNLNRRIQLNIGVTAFSQKLQLVSTVNCQLSTVNCQLSTVNCQLSRVLLRLLNYDVEIRHKPGEEMCTWRIPYHEHM